MKENNSFGYMAETEFFALMTHHIDKSFIDYHPNDIFDYTIRSSSGKEVYLDVKSTEVSHSFCNSKAKNKQYKIGRFLLSDSQIGKNFHIALYIRYKTRFLFLGIIHSSLFKGSKYLSLHALKRTEPIEIEDFLLGLEV